MKSPNRWLAGTLIVLLAMAACSQNSGQAQPLNSVPTTRSVESTVLLHLDIEPGTPLSLLLKHVGDRVLGFDYVMIRTPGTPDDYPSLPQMQLRNISLGQLLQIVQFSYPGVSVDALDGPAGPKFVVHINAPNAVTLDQPATVPTSAASEETIVRVLPLADIVAAYQSQKGLTLQQSLDGVMSLIQAALDQTGDKVPAVLKVHEQTQTLIFKGTQEQLAVVTSVVQSMQPKVDPHQADAQAGTRKQLDDAERSAVRDQETIQQLRKQLVDIQVDNQDKQTQIDNLQKDITNLEAKLREEAQAAEGNPNLEPVPTTPAPAPNQAGK